MDEPGPSQKVNLEVCCAVQSAVSGSGPAAVHGSVGAEDGQDERLKFQPAETDGVNIQVCDCRTVMQRTADGAART